MTDDERLVLTVRLRREGPTRVLINRQGDAVTPARARECGVHVDVVFVRDDGWTLGCPLNLEATAYAFGRTEWVATVPMVSEELLEYEYFGRKLVALP